MKVLIYTLLIVLVTSCNKTIDISYKTLHSDYIYLTLVKKQYSFLIRPENSYQKFIP